MKRPPFDQLNLEEIFKLDASSKRLLSRENGQLEFKEAFNINSTADYGKTMAAFANTSGGYLVFGVKDKPRDLLGLNNDGFDNMNTARFTATLNSALSPEIHWDQMIYIVAGDARIGIIYVHEALVKPVVCTNNAGDLQEGAIYYRYRGQSQKIRYPELRELLDGERRKEQSLWMSAFQKMARIGIENVGVMNSVTGEVSGNGGSFLISEDLLPKLQFIHSGHFDQDAGAPALKLIGSVAPVSASLVQPTKYLHKPIRGLDIIKAFLGRETVLSPLDYVKQVCFEQSCFYPVHFFIQQTKASVKEVIAELQKVEARNSFKDKLIARLNSTENLRLASASTTTPKGQQRRRLFDKLVDKTCTDEDASSDPVILFEALTNLATYQADPQFLLPLLQRTTLPRYTAMPPLQASMMRKALCHLDQVLFRVDK